MYDRAWATKPHAALKGGPTTICPNTSSWLGVGQCMSTKVPRYQVLGTRFLTRVQLHLRLQGMGHENYRSADFLSVQVYVYTKVTLPNLRLAKMAVKFVLIKGCALVVLMTNQP